MLLDYKLTEEDLGLACDLLVFGTVVFRISGLSKLEKLTRIYHGGLNRFLDLELKHRIGQILPVFLYLERVQILIKIFLNQRVNQTKLRADIFGF